MGLWCSAAFRSARVAEAWSSGRSSRPQKRNPGAAELVRGRTGRVIGALTTLLVAMKGLPLAYAKDTQEDKEPVFDAADTLALCIAVITGMVQDIAFATERMKAAAGAGYATATDLADWLVRVLAMPFREAHHVTGRLVRLAEEKGCGLEDLSLEAMGAVEAGITADVFDVLGVENSVTTRTTSGRTAPATAPLAAADARRPRPA